MTSWYMALGLGLLNTSRGEDFLMTEVPLYWSYSKLRTLVSETRDVRSLKFVQEYTGTSLTRKRPPPPWTIVGSWA
jgi:hypothetical protein